MNSGELECKLWWKLIKGTGEEEEVEQMKYNDLLSPGDNGRLNEKTCIKCSLKMSYKCMLLTASIMFSAFSGSLIYIWVSKDLSTILTERSHMT